MGCQGGRRCYAAGVCFGLRWIVGEAVGFAFVDVVSRLWFRLSLVRRCFSLVEDRCGCVRGVFELRTVFWH